MGNGDLDKRGLSGEVPMERGLAGTFSPLAMMAAGPPGWGAPSPPGPPGWGTPPPPGGHGPPGPMPGGFGPPGGGFG
ncbi:MAG: hypothetical protein AAGN82_23715, partial [Myxococcota bacterium]